MNMRNLLLLLFLGFSIPIAHSAPAFVEQSRCTNAHTQTIKTISSSAEIPTPLIPPRRVIPLGCERPFLYRGEIYSSDPPQVQDASTLKYFVREVPDAEALLKDYQENRKRSRMSAYSGTFGLILALLSTPISHLITKSNPDRVGKILHFAGFGLAAGGFIYSFTLLRLNESLIPKSVEAYNQAKPNDPIELQFSTGWSF